MEGYSVTEAASILGVPIERVWELLARGVLAGAPEGETGMRVFLQPRPAVTPSRDEPEHPGPNGGAREPERELSPFRELLTEFRNLTERYGQALLALGESRGEVASLRSRVDLLEARMDLRLPGGGPPPVSPAWGVTTPPFPAAQTVVPTASQAHSAETATDAEVDEAEEHRARPRGPRRATESFAQALARADDPSAPELPGSAEVAEALAAHRHDAVDLAEEALPRELPAAETVPVAEEEAPEEAERSGAPALGPDAADVIVPAESEAEPESAADVGPEPEPEATPEPEPEPEAMLEPEPEPAAQPLAEQLEPDVVAAAAGSEPTDEAHPEPAGEPKQEPVVAGEAPSGASTPEEAAAAEPLEWDAARYTTDIEEPDWYEAEALDDEPPRSLPPEQEPEPEADAEPGAEAEPEPPATAEPEPDASEETLAWLGERTDEVAADPVAGASEMETPAGPPAAEAIPFPGSTDLGAALEALEAIGNEPTPPAPEAPPDVTPRPASPPVPPSALRYRPIGPTSSPAGRAYRRLRRIFPA